MAALEAKKPDVWDDEEDKELEAPLKDYLEFANLEYTNEYCLYKHSEFGVLGSDPSQVRRSAIFDTIIIKDDKSEAMHDFIVTCVQPFL